MKGLYIEHDTLETSALAHDTMTDNTQSTSDDPADDDSALTPKRRKLLGSLGAAAGVASFANPVSGDGDTSNSVNCLEGGRVRTRACDDEALTAGDWSTGAVTARACPSNGGEVTVEVTGRVGTDREQPPEQTNTSNYPNTRETTRANVTQNQTAEVDQTQISCGDGSTQEQTIIIEQHQTTVVYAEDNPGGGAASDASRAVLNLNPGEKLTVWYTGTISHLSASHDDINIAIANRGD